MPLRVVLVMLGVVLWMAAPAGAAPFNELRFRVVGEAGPCIRATGAPGEFVSLAGEAGAELYRVGWDGISAGGFVGVSGSGACPVVAGQANGAAVLAAVRVPQIQDDSAAPGAAALEVAVRDAGGGFGVPVTVARGDPSLGGQLAVAISGRGDAVAAWTVGERARDGVVIWVARRTPGGAFGAPVEVAGWSANEQGTPPALRVGISELGEAVIVWARPRSGSMVVEGAVASAQGGLSRPQRLGAMDKLSAPALAVGADGRALVAFADSGALRVFERVGGGVFEASGLRLRVSEFLAVFPAVALDDAGGGVVAWLGAQSQAVRAVVRARPGPFSAPITLAAGRNRFPDREPSFDDGSLVGPYQIDAFSPGSESGSLQVRVTPDGTALATWMGFHPGVLSGSFVRVAALALSGGVPETSMLGTPLRRAHSIVPLVLDGGAAAVAWSDGDGPVEGRVHVAIENAPPLADLPAPTISISPPHDRVLFRQQELMLDVRCAAACDVQAQIERHSDVLGDVTLAHAGRATLVLEPLERPIAPLRPGPVRVLVSYGAPGAQHPRTLTRTFRLHRPPERPRPHVVGLHAERRGTAVLVAWRTDVRTDASNFTVTGTATRSPQSLPIVVVGLPQDSLRRDFHATLRTAKRVRYVTIRAYDEFPTRFLRETVRVR